MSKFITTGVLKEVLSNIVVEFFSLYTKISSSALGAIIFQKYNVILFNQNISIFS